MQLLSKVHKVQTSRYFCR